MKKVRAAPEEPQQYLMLASDFGDNHERKEESERLIIVTHMKMNFDG